MLNTIKKMILPIAVVVIAIIAVVGIVASTGKTIDLQEYITVEGVEGLNGQGIIAYGLDEDALYAVLMDEKMEEVDENNWASALGSMWSEYETAYNALNCVKLSASKETSLSNGDKVIIKAEFENTEGYEFDFRFKNGSVTYEVSDLPEGKNFDPFAPTIITISFSGYDGYGEVQVEKLKTEEPYRSLQYAVDPVKNLSNGDSVTVSVEYHKEKLEALGYYYPETTEQSYTVSGLKEYQNLAQIITKNDIDTLSNLMLAELKKDIEEELEDSASSKIVKEPEIMNLYYLATNAPDIYIKDYARSIEMQNAVFVSGNYAINYGGVFGTVEKTFVIAFPNCVADDEGKLAFDQETAELYFLGDATAEDVVAWLQDDFEEMHITELKF